MAAAVVYALFLAASMGSVGRSDLAYWIAVCALIPITAIVIRASRFPLAFYGLTWHGAKSAVYSAVTSVALLAASMIVALRVSGALDIPRLASGLLDAWRDPQLLAYVVLATPLQEVIFRGVFQNGARYLLDGNRFASALAIVCSTAAFSLSHLPFGGTPALVMIVPGLVWGLQYEHDRTLVGVVLSHAVTGYLFVGATPLWKLMT